MNRKSPEHFRNLHCLILLAAVLLAGCDEAPQPVEEPPVRPVKMLTIGEDSAAVTFEYPGEITATRSVKLGFEVAGKIIELPVEDGLEMQEGELLGRLDPTDYEAARDAALADLRAARSAYVRAKNIFDEGAGSQARVDKTRRDLKVAEQQLRKAQKALDDTELRAPYDGVVGQKLADNYQNVQAKEPVLIYQDASILEMDVAVPERDFVNMQRDLSLEERTRRARPHVAISTVPGRTFPARIKSFTATADPITRTYKATFQFDKPDDVNILPGMTARVVLDPSPETVRQYTPANEVTVPVAAVASDEQGNPYVWRVDPGTMIVSRVAVELGEIGNSEIAIIAGLETGDRIAISGVSYLYEGARVRPLQ
ncbi:MAG: efflux RND transporter periplasmic adaptor subunit [Gammaproteobacteria bacterium]|jgi:RND family efflux transporter MFP subunit